MAETLRLASTEDLDIVKTFECGQCFRWNADENGVYTGVAFSKAAKVWENDGELFIRSDAPLALWRSYFDLQRDYSEAERRFKDGAYLERCTAFGHGIRILRQDSWEALCSFIISQCNNIPRIKGIVEKLCELYGDETALDGARFHTFPSASRLAGLSESDLSPLRSGYRAQYILSAAADVSEGRIDLDALASMDSELARKTLMTMQGVGEKVANCAVLFGLHHMEAFPIDVWIRRALKEHFPPDFRPDSLGDCAGLAQQYIFYFARSGENTDK